MNFFKKEKIRFLIIFLLLFSVLILMFIMNRENILEKVKGKNYLSNIKKEIEMITTSNIEKEGKVNVVDVSKWDTDVVNIVEDESDEHVKVPVPKGYVASKADGESIVNTGFVIYEGEEEVTTENAWEESLKRNQWVWVPVPDPSRIYEIDSQTGKMKSKLYEYKKNNTERTLFNNSAYQEPGVSIEITGNYNSDIENRFNRFGAQGMTKEKLLSDIEIELEETIKSIEKYGGFYIGRYELGNLSTSFRTFVLHRLNDNIGQYSKSWYDAYYKSKYLGANTNVKTNMIYGCLWDETVQWFIDSGSREYSEIIDSRTWGNCSYEEFEYIDKNGNVAYKPVGNGMTIPTGSTERNKTNNIYDMAGNMNDWTIELKQGGRVDRGGLATWSESYFSGVDRRYSHTSSDGPFDGVRVYMYIK